MIKTCDPIQQLANYLKTYVNEFVSKALGKQVIAINEVYTVEPYFVANVNYPALFITPLTSTYNKNKLVGSHLVSINYAVVRPSLNSVNFIRQYVAKGLIEALTQHNQENEITDRSTKMFPTRIDYRLDKGSLQQEIVPMLRLVYQLFY